jgi:hypothetical protein
MLGIHGKVTAVAPAQNKRKIRTAGRWYCVPAFDIREAHSAPLAPHAASQTRRRDSNKARSPITNSVARSGALGRVGCPAFGEISGGRSGIEERPELPYH